MSTKAKTAEHESEAETQAAAAPEPLTPEKYATLKLKESDLRSALSILESLFPPLKADEDSDLLDPLRNRLTAMKAFETAPPAEPEPETEPEHKKTKAEQKAEAKAEHELAEHRK